MTQRTEKNREAFRHPAMMVHKTKTAPEITLRGSQTVKNAKYLGTVIRCRQTGNRKTATCAAIFVRFCLQNLFLTRTNGREGRLRPDQWVSANPRQSAESALSIV